MQVILPDGKRLDLPDGATGADVAQAIGPGLARAARAVEVEGQLFDLLTPLPDNANVSIVTKGDDKVLHLTRHTLAHVMAQAVREYLSEEGADPADVKMGIGPVIENGFYYDFDLPRSLTPEDLGAIEERMTRIIEDDLELRRYELPVSRQGLLARQLAAGQYAVVFDDACRPVLDGPPVLARRGGRQAASAVAAVLDDGADADT